MHREAQRLKPNHTEAIVAVRIAIVVVEIECSSVRTIVVIAPTFEERIVRVREVGVVRVNPYITQNNMNIILLIPNHVNLIYQYLWKLHKHWFFSIFSCLYPAIVPFLVHIIQWYQGAGLSKCTANPKG